MPTRTISPVFPLQESEGTYSVYGVSDTTKVVDQNIKMVLLTRKGEKIGNPAFGVGLHNYLFEHSSGINFGSTNQPALRSSILTQLNTHIPYIRIDDLSITFGAEMKSLNVKIKYYITDHQMASTFEITISDIGSGVSF